MRVEQRKGGSPSENCYIFGMANVEALKETAPWSPAHTYPAGKALFRQGSWPQEVYLIEQGLVKLTWLAPEGQAIVIGLFSRGAILAAASALLQRALPMTYETLTSCRLCRMSAEDFRSHIRTNPQFFWQLNQWFSHALQTQISYIVPLKTEPAQRRLEYFLLELIASDESTDLSKPIRLRVPLKQWELAQLIDVTPEHLSRLLLKLNRDGILRRDHDCLVILDAQRLASRASQNVA